MKTVNKETLIFHDEEAFKRLCYDLYKTDWQRRKVSTKDFLNTYRDYMLGLMESPYDCNNPEELLDDDLSSTFEQYLDEYGFIVGDERLLYPSFDHFCDLYEKYPRYIKSLIGDECFEAYEGFHNENEMEQDEREV